MGESSDLPHLPKCFRCLISLYQAPKSAFEIQRSSSYPSTTLGLQFTKVKSSMILPEELFQAVEENLAHDTPLIERQLPQLRWKYAINELVPLSWANRQLRRICFPFIFAYVEVQTEYLESFKDQCIANRKLSVSIKTLSVSLAVGGSHKEYKSALKDLLPRLTNLSHTNLKGIPVDMQLLTAINLHPCLTAVPGKR
ncbi:hypothetical protein BT96DRAFT_1010654 [Gymnopus androsaceus JB14]|uniref:Uncharacterized protein n=1 Tax=Gymnopus androsaceus JB14 TaxID=1447944 RepID=A0A6A4GAD5_9AGAR|nr:hypothetical protein BT96DRAFT_1010654 [Gymnopus androsaceus JB14]